MLGCSADLLPKVTSMRERGERSWNGEITFSKVKGRILPTGTARSLEDICRGLARLEEQGKVEGFFNNVENADKLSGAVEDIRDAVIEYQACIRILSATSTSDIRTRLYCSKTSTTRIVSSS